MRKITAFSTCMTLIFALTSCGNNTASDGHSETFSGTDADQIAISAENETEKTITADSESVGGQYGCEAMPEGTPCKVTLKMDFTNGRDTADILEKEYIFCYRDPDGEDVEVVPQDIIRGLLEETGFSFSAAIEQKDDGIHIDFNADSSLFASNQAAGHDEKYTFFETQSKAWFILDTIAANMEQFGENFNVYVSYCGKPIVLDAVLAFDGTDTRKEDGPITIPSDKPYQGSSYYCAHIEEFK